MSHAVGRKPNWELSLDSTLKLTQFLCSGISPCGAQSAAHRNFRGAYDIVSCASRRATANCLREPIRRTLPAEGLGGVRQKCPISPEQIAVFAVASKLDMRPCCAAAFVARQCHGVVEKRLDGVAGGTEAAAVVYSGGLCLPEVSGRPGATS